MATAKKLPSGSWRCQVYSHTEKALDPKTGKEKNKRIYKSFTCDVPGPKGKRIAEQMAAEWAAEKETTTAVTDITLGEAIDRYIASRESILSPRTIMDYKRIRKNDLQGIMHIKISVITQEDIQREINQDALKHSPKTVRNNHGLISAVLGLYRPNFAIKTDLPKKVRPDLYIPSDAEVARLMNITRDTEMELPILLAAFGPMRRGEICAVSADDISGNIIHVHRNMVRTEAGSWILKSPKSYAGDRYIEFPDFVAEKWKARNGRLVNLNPNQITRKFNDLLKRSGMPVFRFHDLRHYSASIQHALGIPDAYIMQRGGWGNDHVLKEVYRHAMKDKAIEMSKIADAHFESLCNTEYNTK